MTIETLKSPNPRNRNSIKSKCLFVSAMNTLLAILKSLTRDVTSYLEANCTTDFLGDTSPPPQPLLAFPSLIHIFRYLKNKLKNVNMYTM